MLCLRAALLLLVTGCGQTGGDPSNTPETTPAADVVADDSEAAMGAPDADAPGSFSAQWLTQVGEDLIVHDFGATPDGRSAVLFMYRQLDGVKVPAIEKSRMRFMRFDVKGTRAASSDLNIDSVLGSPQMMLDETGRALIASRGRAGDRCAPYGITEVAAGDASGACALPFDREQRVALASDRKGGTYVGTRSGVIDVMTPAPIFLLARFGADWKPLWRLPATTMSCAPAIDCPGGAEALANDATGNAYAVNFESIARRDSLAVRRVSASGAVVWTSKIRATELAAGSEGCSQVAIAVDDKGVVTVSGAFRGNADLGDGKNAYAGTDWALFFSQFGGDGRYLASTVVRGASACHRVIPTARGLIVTGEIFGRATFGLDTIDSGGGRLVFGALLADSLEPLRAVAIGPCDHPAGRCGGGAASDGSLLFVASYSEPITILGKAVTYVPPMWNLVVGRVGVP